MKCSSSSRENHSKTAILISRPQDLSAYHARNNPLSLRPAVLRSLAYADRRPFAHMLAELECIPVGEPDAAVRAVLAHGFRVGCAVDPITLRRERDPHETNRIVGPWRKVQGLLNMDASEIQGGVVVVGGILRDTRDLELAR